MGDHAPIVIFCIVIGNLIIGGLGHVVEFTFLGEKDLRVGVLAMDVDVAEQLQKVVVDDWPVDLFYPLALFGQQLLLNLFLLAAVLQLLIPALIGQGHLGHLIVLQSQFLLVSALFPRKHHVEPICLKVVPDAVRTSRQHPVIDVFLLYLFLFDLSSSL